LKLKVRNFQDDPEQDCPLQVLKGVPETERCWPDIQQGGLWEERKVGDFLCIYLLEVKMMADKKES
jgi:hypothetical protein